MEINPERFGTSPVSFGIWSCDYNIYLNEPKEGMVIPKDAYVLYCIKENGDGEIVYPLYYSDNEYQFNTILITSAGSEKPRPKSPYMFDYADVKKYIKDNLSNKYSKVLVAKISDVLSIEIESCAKERP